MDLVFFFFFCVMRDGAQNNRQTTRAEQNNTKTYTLRSREKDTKRHSLNTLFSLAAVFCVRMGTSEFTDWLDVVAFSLVKK